MFYYQTAELARFNVHAKGLTSDQADWMIGRLKAREALGLATVKQVRKLRQFGHSNALKLTVAQASHAISSDWRIGNKPKQSAPVVRTFANRLSDLFNQ